MWTELNVIQVPLLSTRRALADDNEHDGMHKQSCSDTICMQIYP